MPHLQSLAVEIHVVELRGAKTGDLLQAINEITRLVFAADVRFVIGGADFQPLRWRKDKRGGVSLIVPAPQIAFAVETRHIRVAEGVQVGVGAVVIAHPVGNAPVEFVLHNRHIDRAPVVLAIVAALGG